MTELTCNNNFLAKFHLFRFLTVLDCVINLLNYTKYLNLEYLYCSNNKIEKINKLPEYLRNLQVDESTHIIKPSNLI